MRENRNDKEKKKENGVWVRLRREEVKEEIIGLEKSKKLKEKDAK